MSKRQTPLGWKVVLGGLLLIGSQLGMAQNGAVSLDRVVAIVDKDVVLESELNARKISILERLRGQYQQLPPEDVLNRQILDQLILERIELGMAERYDISIEEAEIDQAIELAHLRSFIDSLPQGDATVVGERGLKVSGGEKQRIAIARAILKGSPILVFDEATSALDSASEQAILQAMRDVARNHTSVVIAHRLSTITDADTIIVLKNGQLAEQGSHQQLLAAAGEYARMWQLQQKQQH